MSKGNSRQGRSWLHAFFNYCLLLVIAPFESGIALNSLLGEPVDKDIHQNLAEEGVASTLEFKCSLRLFSGNDPFVNLFATIAITSDNEVPLQTIKSPI